MARWLISFTVLIVFFIHVIESDPKRHDLNIHWEDFKDRYNKTYSKASEFRKKTAWKKNYHAIAKHNEEASRGLKNYTLNVNHLADMSRTQYVKDMVKLVKHLRRPGSDEIIGVPHHNTAEIPEELDWRELGFVTPSYNQEDCGSCYAFSVSACIQGQVFKQKKKLEYFSVQQLVDCSVVNGNLGCSGGSLRNTFRYIQQVGGMMHEQDYPYKAEQKVCRYHRSRSAVRLKSWAILPPKDENALKVALAVIGPLSVSINASPSTFQLYSSGIYDDPKCTSNYVNHAMLLVGYTKNAWILKNWWSEHWGEKGYMLLARGSNKCAISNYAVYATIF